MLLRSSSTPVLGSLLPSFGESPSNNNNNHHQTEVPSKGSPYFHHNYHYHYNYNYSKISYPKHAAGSPNLMSSSSAASVYNSSPSVVDLSSGNSSSFRRAQSEGNLEALVSSAATFSDDVDEFISSKKFAPRYHSHSSTLEPILSFSYRNSNDRLREDEDSEEEEEEVDIEEQAFTTESTNLSGDSLCSSLGNVDYKTDYRRYINVGFEEETYLAKGLGIADMSFVCNGSHGGGGGGRGGGEGCKPVAYDGDGGDNNNSIRIEEHYKRLLEENPSNPLYLRNYAQFLHQVSSSSLTTTSPKFFIYGEVVMIFISNLFSQINMCVLF